MSRSVWLGLCAALVPAELCLAAPAHGDCASRAAEVLAAVRGSRREPRGVAWVVTAERRWETAAVWAPNAAVGKSRK